MFIKEIEVHLFTTSYVVFLYSDQDSYLIANEQLKLTGVHFKDIIHGFSIYNYLKRIKIIGFILLSFSLQVSAPTWKSFTIVEFPPVEPYKQLVLAIGMVETKGDTLAYNPIEDATGYFQIRPIRLIDYNKRTGSNYSRKDLFNYETSEKIFLYFADQIGPYNLELVAKKWNGSGQLTINYWHRIKQYL